MPIQAGTRYCGTNFFGSADTDWNLCTGADGFRTWAKDITFPTQFSVVPAVIVALKGFHILSGDPRIEVGTTTVLATGFTVTVKTWGDTQVAGVAVQWIAHDDPL
jgi:hypothetical protein